MRRRWGVKIYGVLIFIYIYIYIFKKHCDLYSTNNQPNLRNPGWYNKSCQKHDKALLQNPEITFCNKNYDYWLFHWSYIAEDIRNIDLHYLLTLLHPWCFVEYITSVVWWCDICCFGPFFDSYRTAVGRIMKILKKSFVKFKYTFVRKKLWLLDDFLLNYCY